MAKIDDVMTALEQSFTATTPCTALYRTTVEDKNMEHAKVRRKGPKAATHLLWALSIGDSGKPTTVFYGHRPSECIKKAQTWLGLPTVTRRKKVAEK